MLVKRPRTQALACGLWVAFTLLPAGHADDANPVPTDTAPIETIKPLEEEKLPDIEARIFDLNVARRSRSERVYLLAPLDKTAELPLEGRVLLLKKDSSPAMAVLILKVYPETFQFAGKKVRAYDSFEKLNPGDKFKSVQKISDIIPAPPEQTPQDRADLREIEAKPTTAPLPPLPNPAQAVEPALVPSSEASKAGVAPDAPPPPPGGSSAVVSPEITPEASPSQTPPPPPGAISEPVKSDSDDESRDDQSSVIIEEINPLDTNRFGISAELAFIRNAAPQTVGSGYYVGGGIRGSLELGQSVFLKGARLQDSLGVELGVFNYRVAGFKIPADSFTLYPIIGTLRYSLIFSEDFSLYFYAGLVYNLITSNTAATDADSIAQLGQVQPAGGMGLLFRVGPSWYTRVDLGIDMIGLGLVLRF